MNSCRTKDIKVVSITYFNELFSGKDIFLAPFYISSGLDGSFSLVFPKDAENARFGSEYRNCELIPIKSLSRYDGTFWSEKEMFWWLIKNAHKIDVLALFWLSPRNIIFAKVYKLLNPKGICYVKGDFNEKDFIKSSLHGNKIRTYIKTYLLKSIDILSVETQLVLEKVQKGFLGQEMADRVEYMPNSFDIDLFNSFNITLKSWKDKENLIITVARIGHPDKNNEMMLQGLDKLDIGDWKFIFIGPIEDSFLIKYEHFIKNNPQLKGKVTLHGAAKSRSELWEMYNAAKVFVLTSPKEGFPNVFADALFFSNYIITTDVSSASDVTKNNTFGAVIPCDGVEKLHSYLKLITRNSLNLDKFETLIKMHSQKFIWPNAVKNVCQKISAIYYELNK